MSNTRPLACMVVSESNMPLPVPFGVADRQASVTHVLLVPACFSVDPDAHRGCPLLSDCKGRRHAQLLLCLRPNNFQRGTEV